MKEAQSCYIDLYGAEWDLGGFDAEERSLLADLRKHARRCKDKSGTPAQRWIDFNNYRLPKIIAFYELRGLSRKQIARAPLHRIGQDLSGRLGIALGVVRKPDYRDSLDEIIKTRFKTRRKFCEATGISEDMLSHVLAGRKDLSVKALSQALDRIGYSIRFVPREPSKKKPA